MFKWVPLSLISDDALIGCAIQRERTGSGKVALGEYQDRSPGGKGKEEEWRSQHMTCRRKSQVGLAGV